MKEDKESIRYRPYDRSSGRKRSRSNDSVNNGQQPTLNYPVTKIRITPVSIPIDVVDLDNPTTKPGSIPLSELIDSVSTINARLTLNLDTDSRNELTDYKNRLMAEIDNYMDKRPQYSEIVGLLGAMKEEMINEIKASMQAWIQDLMTRYGQTLKNEIREEMREQRRKDRKQLGDFYKTCDLLQDEEENIPDTRSVAIEPTTTNAINNDPAEINHTSTSTSNGTAVNNPTTSSDDNNRLDANN